MLGGGIALLVLGAIVAFVLQIDIPGMGDQALGLILMVAGLAAVALSFARRRQIASNHTVVSRNQDATGSFVEERHTA